MLCMTENVSHQRWFKVTTGTRTGQLANTASPAFQAMVACKSKGTRSSRDNKKAKLEADIYKIWGSGFK